MRVSCPFVLLAIFLAAESHCAPIAPFPTSGLTTLPGLSSAPGLQGLPLDGLPSADKLPLSGAAHALPGMSSMSPFKLARGPSSVASIPSLPSFGAIPDVSKFSSMNPASGFSGLVPTSSVPGVPDVSQFSSMSPASGISNYSPTGLPNVAELPSINPISKLGEVPSASMLDTLSAPPGVPSVLIPGSDTMSGLTSSIPIPKNKRGLGNFGSLSALPSIPGTGASGFPAFGSVPFGATNFGNAGGLSSPFSGMAGMSSIPSFPGANSISGLTGALPTPMAKRGLGNFGSGMASGGALPFGSFNSIPGMNAGGIPVIGSPSDAVSSFFGSSGFSNPLAGGNFVPGMGGMF